ncbi:MAG: RpiB/LacA/LacB family sugar-phosphate isomerase, partial [Dermabacteraceae bacterium]
MGWKIVTGSDNAGYGHKSALKELLESDPRVDEVIDVGVTGREDGTFYPDVSVEAAEKIAAGEADRALLVCGTGLGVAIAANKVSGVR